MPAKAILFFMFPPSIFFGFSFPVFPSGMILCYLLCSFYSSFCLAFIKFRQVESCTLGYPFTFLNRHTHPTCALGILRKCPNRWPKCLSLFYGQERKVEVNHFVLGKLLASLLKSEELEFLSCGSWSLHVQII